MKTETLASHPAFSLALPAPESEQRKFLHIRNVLVPVDFSVASSEAIEFAVPLVKRFGAEPHLIHVLEPHYTVTAFATLPLVVPELEVGRRVRRHLKGLARKHGMELAPENIHCLKGRPYEEICGLACDQEMDLIVIATRGNTGLTHFLLGSTAERVVRFSPCPVLIVRRGDWKTRPNRNGHSTPVLKIRKILVPIDFSDSSMKGLAYAKAFAKEFGARLLLFHSVHLRYYVTNDEYARYDFALLMQHEGTIARDLMRDLVRKTDWEGIEIESFVESGHPGDEICTRAKEKGADLIVTATHGRTGLKHVLIGSTAEYVAQHSPCPVLVVPTRDRPAIISAKNEL